MQYSGIFCPAVFYQETHFFWGGGDGTKLSNHKTVVKQNAEESIWAYDRKRVIGPKVRNEK